MLIARRRFYDFDQILDFAHKSLSVWCGFRHDSKNQGETEDEMADHILRTVLRLSSKNNFDDKDTEPLTNNQSISQIVLIQTMTDIELAVGSSEEEQEKVNSNRRPTVVWCNKHRPESLLFAMRISVSLALASLFTLLSSPKDEGGYPEAVWIYLTAGIVAWQASPDVASSTKKAAERIVGTLLGAFWGLTLGCLSIANFDQGSREQAIFLGLSSVATNFLFSYTAAGWGLRSQYPAMLAFITCGIVFLAFYEEDVSRPWELGLLRVGNVIVGCVIAGVTSFVIFPLSTKRLLETKIEVMMKDIGLSARRVLEAANTGPPPSLVHLVKNLADVEDEAHQLYIENMEKWKDTRQLFSLLQYDPVFRMFPESKRKEFVEYIRMVNGRAMRLQVTIVMMDGLLRARLHEGDSGSDPTDVLLSVGACVATLLDRSSTKEARETAEDQLLQDLVEVRKHLVHVRTKFSLEEVDEISGPALVQVLSTFDEARLEELQSPGQTALFYRLIEQLIFRTVRLHRFCSQYELKVTK